MLADSVVFPPDRKFVLPETFDAFFAVVERLETTLADETAALAAQRHRGLAEFTRQKRQGFLEFNRIMRQLDNTIPSQEIIGRLSRFERTLDANATMLQRHLSAVKEVTDTIVRVMRDAESDGTYSRAYGRADHDEF